MVIVITIFGVLATAENDDIPDERLHDTYIRTSFCGIFILPSEESLLAPKKRTEGTIDRQTSDAMLLA